MRKRAIREQHRSTDSSVDSSNGVDGSAPAEAENEQAGGPASIESQHQPVRGFSVAEAQQVRRSALEEAEREARYRRWDEIETTTHRGGLATPASRPAQVTVRREVSSPSPFEPVIPAGAFLTPKPGFEEPWSARNDEVIIVSDLPVEPVARKRRSQLVIRLEAANKVAFAAGKVASTAKVQPAATSASRERVVTDLI